MKLSRSSGSAVVLAAAAALAFAACETPPVSPAEIANGAAIVPPAHASPDPPPAKPVMVEEADAGRSVGSSVDGGDGGDGGLEGGASEAGASTALPVIDADDVIVSLRGKFRTCYERGLADDRNQRGRLLLTATISPQGDVLTVAPTQIELLNGSVVGCMVSVLKAAHFSAPGGKGATLQVPLTFTKASGP